MCYPSLMAIMTIDSSELARQLAARRKPKAVVCPICGTQAIGVGRRKYCSEQCAKRAWWRRHRSKAAQLGQDAAAVQRWEDDGGAIGSRGPRGDTGAVGPQGPPGPKGAPGVFDNPVRPTSIIGNGPPLIVGYCLLLGSVAERFHLPSCAMRSATATGSPQCGHGPPGPTRRPKR